jgi:calcium-dependent protein kinase
MYILLSGVPPFDGKNEIEIINNVKAGIFDLTIPELKSVSLTAKSLITNML